MAIIRLPFDSMLEIKTCNEPANRQPMPKFTESAVDEGNHHSADQRKKSMKIGSICIVKNIKPRHRTFPFSVLVPNYRQSPWEFSHYKSEFLRIEKTLNFSKLITACLAIARVLISKFLIL